MTATTERRKTIVTMGNATHRSSCALFGMIMWVVYFAVMLGLARFLQYRYGSGGAVLAAHLAIGAVLTIFIWLPVVSWLRRMLE